MIGNSNSYLLSTTNFEALTYFKRHKVIATGTFGWNRMRLDEPVTVSFTRSTVTNNKGFNLF